jgi:GTP-sensing pleiotropic transcriptional regulator CodY
MGLDSPCHEAATAALNNGTIEILKSSFVEMQESTYSKEDFMKMLTNAETRAYYSIIREIRDEGNITISKLVEKNSISRPVYNNLITKLKEHNIASVTNMGMKGTYIKILHPELKAEAIDLY